MQAMFVAFVNDFTAWHLRLLQFADDPVYWTDKFNYQFGGMVAGKLTDLIEHVYENLRDRREFCNQVWRDLFSRGLVSIDKLDAPMYKQDLLLPRTTQFGKQFLKFINTPNER